MADEDGTMIDAATMAPFFPKPEDGGNTQEVIPKRVYSWG